MNANDSNRFSPQDVTISAGQKVCWQNTGAMPHTVTSDDGPGSADDGTTFGGSLGAGAFYGGDERGYTDYPTRESVRVPPVVT